MSDVSLHYSLVVLNGIKPNIHLKPKIKKNYLKNMEINLSGATMNMLNTRTERKTKFKVILKRKVTFADDVNEIDL